MLSVQQATVPVLRYNNYGGSIGGPILRNRMFFYFDYDKTKDFGGASNGFETVPTAAELRAIYRLADHSMTRRRR